MLPKRIEYLPILETPADDSSSSGLVVLETRGTHSDRLSRHISGRGRLLVTLCQSNGHPISPNATSFMTKLGLSVKKFAPLQTKSWKHAPAENKRMIYNQLSAAFDISFQKGTWSVMKETDQLMSARYRDNRTKMHNHYKKLSHLPPAERRQHIPIEFYETQDNWDYMCVLFESKAFQDDMVRLSDECILSQNSEEDINVVQIADIVCDQVLSTRFGYIRGLGSGSKQVRSTCLDASSSSRSTNNALRERLEFTQD
ncbi:hypothetical protein ZIOFF_001852 [Zingiber officinale]|uniref:Uncharacterized protein n=1 Tax=Zingiber officinale TaxID=94328 RepID=A0A8J5INT8_ZINOF|nr:hypothetical protein ZIOFF_001852 [Zingiber officinale]